MTENPHRHTTLKQIKEHFFHTFKYAHNMFSLTVTHTHTQMNISHVRHPSVINTLETGSITRRLKKLSRAKCRATYRLSPNAHHIS